MRKYVGKYLYRGTSHQETEPEPTVALAGTIEKKAARAVSPAPNR